MQFKLELTGEHTSTTVSQPSPETINDKLNRLAKECGFDNISPWAVQLERNVDGPNGVTLLFNRNPDQVFTLNPVVAAPFRPYTSEGRNRVPEDYTGTVAVHRIMIGYASLARINTAVDMQRVMGPLINEAVKDFIDEVGFLQFGYRITGQQPGHDNVYFRDIDNMAGMEFRLCLIKG